MALKLPDWFGFEFREKWERFADWLKALPVRRWINNNPKAVGAITVFSAFLFLAILASQLTRKRPPLPQVSEKEWFYDLNTSKLFAAEKGLAAPIAAPSGPLPTGQPAGVRAYVLSYAYDPNESERFIGFLEMANPTTQARASRSSRIPTSGLREWGRGKLVRRVDDAAWVPADSRLGVEIIEEAFKPNENGERPYYCPP